MKQHHILFIAVSGLLCGYGAVKAYNFVSPFLAFLIAGIYFMVIYNIAKFYSNKSKNKKQNNKQNEEN